MWAGVRWPQPTSRADQGKWEHAKQNAKQVSLGFGVTHIFGGQGGGDGGGGGVSKRGHIFSAEPTLFMGTFFFSLCLSLYVCALWLYWRITCECARVIPGSGTSGGAHHGPTSCQRDKNPLPRWCK